jgi:molybdate transport system ATP-binding protein|tara:strand:- start:125 stop:1177 length:1053 start_codon:yes stop_codon:yes gene_type:complete
MGFIDINITKKYPDFVLNCSLDFNNKINGIFGPSGSGKSTILNCIAGFISPDIGKIKINDKILYEISNSNSLNNKNISINTEHRNIGYVTQKSNLFPSMNVEENIRYGYKDDNAIKVEEIIDIMNVKNLIHRYPMQLSGGEAQKISIARALARFPSVLLMDEPVSELDLKSKLMVLGYLKKINKRFGIPIIYVSHDIAEIVSICDKVAMIENGKIKDVKNSQSLTYISNNDLEFENIYVLNESMSGNSIFINNVKINILNKLESESAVILIPSNSVMLSKAMINNIDAENILSGKINNITLIGSKVRIFCNVGFDIVSDISEYSFKKMNLNINDEIYVIFKSENVKISYT